MIFVLFILLLFLCYIDAITLRSINIQIDCVNGTQIRGHCVCQGGFTGKYCNIKMNCKGLKLMANGSCHECLEGWTGPNCDLINCGKNGIAKNAHKCNCSAPYSGQFCDHLLTDDVYFLYNKRMYNYGIILMPIAIIPMVIILYCCNKMAKRRKFERLEHILHQMRRSGVNKELLEKLLEEAV